MIVRSKFLNFFFYFFFLSFFGEDSLENKFPIKEKVDITIPKNKNVKNIDIILRNIFFRKSIYSNIKK